MFSSPCDDTEGRISVPPSLIKAAGKYLATLPQCSLWSSCLFQAEEDTKLTSGVLPVSRNVSRLDGIAKTFPSWWLSTVFTPNFSSHLEMEDI